MSDQEREFTYKQLWGTEAAIDQDRERIAQLRADDELRNGRKLPPPLPHVEFNLEKSSRESERESEILAWCDDLKAERDELRDSALEIANHNSQLLEVCRNKDETIAGLRSALDRSHQEHLADIRELQEFNNNQIGGVGQSKDRVIESMQNTIDEQDTQIENLFQQLQELDNRPY